MILTVLICFEVLNLSDAETQSAVSAAALWEHSVGMVVFGL